MKLFFFSVGWLFCTFPQRKLFIFYFVIYSFRAIIVDRKQLSLVADQSIPNSTVEYFHLANEFLV